MQKLDISGNNLHAEGGKVLATVLENNQTITELNIAGNKLHWNTKLLDDLSGIAAVTKAAKSMLALISFDISDNKVTASSDGAHVIAQALVALEQLRMKREWTKRSSVTLPTN